MSKTALIILNYNHSLDTLNCVESILAHNTAQVKFVVVDNASRADEAAALRSVMQCLSPDCLYLREGDAWPTTLPDYTLIEALANHGYARGNNLGLKAVYADAEVDTVMVLNNDILFIADIIPPMLELLRDLPDCGILSPVLYKADGKEYDYNCARRLTPVSAMVRYNFLFYWWLLRGTNMESQYSGLYLLNSADRTSDVVPIDLPSGSCMLATKDLWQRIGGFDPETFLFYEENILYHRIRRLGLQNYLTLSEACIHLGATTMRRIANNMLVVRSSKQSERYYVRRYSGAKWPMRLLHRLSVAFYLTTVRLSRLLKKK